MNRWLRRVAASRTHKRPELDRLADLLRAGLPTQQHASIVHGDFRLDNVLIEQGSVVSAVLVCEMATLGDPLTDLASACVWWDGLAGMDCPVAAVPSDVIGFPPSGLLLERYAVRSGTALDEYAWYRAFAYFKIAVIFEGIIARGAVGRGGERDQTWIASRPCSPS